MKSDSNPKIQESQDQIATEIKNWNALNRNNSGPTAWSEIISIATGALTDLNWYFLLDRALFANSTKIHIYAGLDNQQKLSLFYIDAKDDLSNVIIDSAMTRLTLLDLPDTDGQKFSIPDSNHSSHAVSPETAEKRVYRWGTNWMRNAWIKDAVNRPISDDDNLNFLFSVMVIDTSDLNQLPTANYFACFLSLKEEIKNNKMIFTPDLTIVDIDAQTGSMNYKIEDVVYSIPPIKPKFEYSEFGALKQLVPNPKVQA